MRRLVSLAAVSALGMSALIGCAHQQPVSMAPPVQSPGYSAPPAAVSNMAPPQGGMTQAGNSVFQWQDVPPGQQVPVARAAFDQGGYQIYAQTGETIVVPFVNNNMYVMKFGRTNGQSYFINENGVPTLYLQPGAGLANAAAQGAMWYPIPQNYAYSQPMYVAVAPTWNDYVNMGWYPGMTYYGGMWGYTPYSHFSWMPGFYISIGGRRYSDYGGYYHYYTTTPGYIRNRVVYNTYNTPRSIAGRTFGSTGSYRSGSTGSYRSGSSGSFGTGRVSGSTGSFGSGSTRRTFGGSTFGGSPSTSTGSFGSGSSRRTFGGSTFGGGSSSSSGGSFGSGRSSGSSFGGGTSGVSSTPRSSGSSFGGGRSSGSSFGGGRSSGSSSGSFGRRR